MAINGPKYEQSAIDLISPMLTVNQMANQANAERKRGIYEGVKGLMTGTADAVNWYQRQRKVEFVGHNKLNDMIDHLNELERELESVNNHIRAIKAEDIGSLDTFANTPTTHNAEQDVNDYNVDGGRFSNTRIDSYESAAEYNPNEDDFEHPEANARENIPPEVKAKYKVGLRALGGR